jgi:hypothetical protein
VTNLLAKKTGQTGRLFKTRFKEHIQAIKSNKSSSMYDQHILNTGHMYSQLGSTTDILQIVTKGKYMNTLEKLYI